MRSGEADIYEEERTAAGSSYFTDLETRRRELEQALWWLPTEEERARARDELMQAYGS